jgi:hypothetical protein
MAPGKAAHSRMGESCLENHNMKIFKFFEFMARMGQIVRWSLMRNIRQEDLKQHSFEGNGSWLLEGGLE